MNIIQIWFDGGCGAYAYGSWEAQYQGMSKRVHKQVYGYTVFGGKFPDWTCNVAEYTALINALEWLRLDKPEQQRRYSLQIWSDSMLVVNQVKGTWRTKKEHLRELCGYVQDLLRAWGSYTISWHGRINNVSRFGH